MQVKLVSVFDIYIRHIYDDMSPDLCSPPRGGSSHRLLIYRFSSKPIKMEMCRRLRQKEIELL